MKKPVKKKRPADFNMRPHSILQDVIALSEKPGAGFSTLADFDLWRLQIDSAHLVIGNIYDAGGNGAKWLNEITRELHLGPKELAARITICETHAP